MRSSQSFWVLIFALCVFTGCGGNSVGGGIVPPSNSPPLTINTAAQPDGVLNLLLDFQFTVANGLQPFTWSETGALPTGLNFSPQGDLAGTPTESGSFPITVTVHDSAGESAVPAGVTIQIFPHGFQAIGDMETERAAHTATLLTNGKVLVTGGFNNTDVLATAELFDPATGTFTPTGAMTASRFSHTATLLPNGNVLITGGSPNLGDLATHDSRTATLRAKGKVLAADGSDNSDDLATAELFDPATGTFTATGSMIEQRSEHTATLLANGKVLLACGTADNVAELYDPATEIFTATTGELTVGGRWGCTATLLNDGKVLIAGGRDAEDVFDALPLDDAEIFDPSTGTFTATGVMTEFRYDHTATLLNNGKVLLAGGTNGNSVSDAELFDPTIGTFSATLPMTSPRAQHTATLLNDGTVLVAGGFSFFPAPGGGFPNVDIFDPATNTFAPADPLGTGRYLHTATRLNSDQVLITGGAATNSYLKSAELYK
jgi:putative Ig domain-containing protein/galactose oxidase-like protein/Kelch motif protein